TEPVWGCFNKEKEKRPATHTLLLVKAWRPGESRKACKKFPLPFTPHFFSGLIPTARLKTSPFIKMLPNPCPLYNSPVGREGGSYSSALLHYFEKIPLKSLLLRGLPRNFTSHSYCQPHSQHDFSWVDIVLYWVPKSVINSILKLYGDYGTTYVEILVVGVIGLIHGIAITIYVMFVVYAFIIQLRNRPDPQLNPHIKFQPWLNPRAPFMRWKRVLTILLNNQLPDGISAFEPTPTSAPLYSYMHGIHGLTYKHIDYTCCLSI
ncbi:hypothetical protein Ocin01_17622, partial [Orchesella cincta]